MEQRRYEPVYSKRVRAGKRRTYFFDVRQTKGGDYFLTLTESTRKFDGDGYERHKLFLYKEDFNRFMAGLQETVDYVKTELMPDYDYDEFTRRQEEWEAAREAERLLEKENNEESATDATEETKDEEAKDESTGDNEEIESEEDISW